MFRLKPDNFLAAFKDRNQINFFVKIPLINEQLLYDYIFCLCFSISLGLESSSLSGCSMVYELVLGSQKDLAAGGHRTQMLEYLLATGIIVQAISIIITSDIHPKI